MSLVIFEVFDNNVQAHLMKSKLESEGIPCFLFDENIVTLNPMFSNLMGGIKLKIPEEHLERAKQIYSEIKNQPIVSESGYILRCPQCNSDQIDPNFRSVEDGKGIIAMILSFIFFVYPFYFKRVNRCKACGHQFAKRKNSPHHPYS